MEEGAYAEPYAGARSALALLFSERVEGSYLTMLTLHFRYVELGVGKD